MDRENETIGEEILPEADSEVAEEHPMDALLDAEAYELETPRRGEIRKGTIARITENDVLVDIGAKSEGLIPSRELEQLTDEQKAELQVGSEINVYVVRSADRDGTLLLSISRAEEEEEWQKAEELLESEETYEGVISGYNKGGLIVKFGHLRGFIPASQVSLARRRRAEGETPDQRWGKMAGEPIIAKVIEVDRRRNRLILSERAAARESRDALKERLISELKPGEIRTGTVISLADFGAFVDIGGADGLVHISELSWKRVDHPKDVLKVGQEIEVKVLNVDPERKRISLSLRELEANPWDEILASFTEGQLVEGTITKLTKFGAFATIKDIEDYEIEGLIHISELSDQRIEHPREVVQEGQTLALRLIKIDRDRRRLGLSLKRVDSAEFADVDWHTAMQEIASEEEEEPQAEAAAEVEDFDAALEGEISDLPPGETQESDELADAEGMADSEAPQGEGEVEAEAEIPEAEAGPPEQAEPPEAEAELPEAEAELPEAEAEPPKEAELPEAEAELPEAEAELPEAEAELPEGEEPEGNEALEE
jgi:small subunit ribosomal protein S1